MIKYEEWRGIHDKGFDSFVLFGEKLLDHNGLLVLNDFITVNSCNLIFVSSDHTKCAELFAKLALVEHVVLIAENEIADLLLGSDIQKTILIGGSKKEYPYLAGLIAAGTNRVEYYSPSSSSFVNILPADMKAFISELFRKYTYAEIIERLAEFKDLNILVIGETIIDEYIFTSAMNKSNKEPIIASQYLYEEKYAGGVLAVANHLASFCNNVKLITRIGDTDSHKDFIMQHLKDNVEATFLVRDDSPTIRKQRIVEQHLARKMFEVYFINNKPVTKKNNEEFEQELLQQLPAADLVIVTDYGHGLFTDKAVKVIEEKAKFLAVNTQTNAGNKGFNLISKYQKADFIAIDQPEAQLECRSKEVPIGELIYQIAENTNCPRITVTMGKGGNFYLYKGEIHRVPMLSVKAIDTTGAGDAFFSLASCAAASNFSPELTGFIGNIAGAEACMIIGNKESITIEGMQEHIKNIAELAGVEYE